MLGKGVIVSGKRNFSRRWKVRRLVLAIRGRINKNDACEKKQASRAQRRSVVNIFWCSTSPLTLTSPSPI